MIHGETKPEATASLFTTKKKAENKRILEININTEKNKLRTLGDASSNNH